MSQNYRQLPVLSLSKRIAEESQLLAEEKWIIDALKKIKSQRNCLQIERLQLESMKSQLKGSTSKNLAEAAKHIEPKRACTTFSINMATPKPPTETATAVLTTPNRKFLETEASCNKETLQLGLDNNIFSMIPTQQFNMEEYEEEEENDDDLNLDMSMFMNCAQKQQQ